MHCMKLCSYSALSETVHSALSPTTLSVSLYSLNLVIAKTTYFQTGLARGGRNRNQDLMRLSFFISSFTLEREKMLSQINVVIFLCAQNELHILDEKKFKSTVRKEN